VSKKIKFHVSNYLLTDQTPLHHLYASKGMPGKQLIHKWALKPRYLKLYDVEDMTDLDIRKTRTQTDVVISHGKAV
jgi:hypothetical protein